MSRNNIIILLSMFLLCLTSVFSTYPQASILSSPNSLEDPSITLKGWLGTSAKIELNNQVITSSLTFTNTNITSIPLDKTMDQVQIDVAVGETFNFVHSAQSQVTYDILIVKDSTQIFRQTLSSGITQNIKIDEPGTYTIQDVNTGISKQFSVNYGEVEKTIPIELNYISDGMNSLRISTQTPSGQSSIIESTFSFEKYANSITFTSENTTKTSSITGVITAEQLSDSFYYILNQEGFIPNCGEYEANKLEFSANGDQVTIRNLQEGNNVVRIISTSSNCDLISGEYRFEVFVDRVAPRLNLVEATYGRSGTSNEGEFEPEVFEQDQVYTNIDIITLFYDSKDIEKIEYILNGRKEGLLVNEEKIDLIPNIENFFVESDGSTLDITLRPYSEYVDSYVLWSYGRIQERREEIKNGEIKISLDLDEERSFNITYFEGDGSDYLHNEIEIYELAYQEVGEIEIIDTVDGRGLYQINLDLEEGKNNISFLAYDRSGNIGKKVMTINIDTQDPNLVDKSDFDPTPGSTVHFPIQKLKGTVNKEDMYIEVFTIPEGEQEFKDFDGVSRDATCSNFEQYFLLRAIDDLNRQRPRSTTLNLQEIQFDLSLQSLLLNKESTRSDANGKFEIYVGLEEESFDRSDVNNPDDRTIDRSTSRNKVCIVMADNYGNVNVEELSYTLDSGNTMWKEAEITTTPNSIYAAEIEQIGERRSGSGKVQFSMIARFQYLGSGTVDEITSFKISLDRGRDSDPFQGRGNILNSGINYVFDKSTNELIAYVPIEISPLNQDPLEYPDEIKFSFQAIINYDLDDRDLPIDTANPIYFEALVNIERPLDHTKWLTPSTIEGGLEFINKTIKFTEKARDIMKYASLGSVLYCTGYKFYHAACLASAEDDNARNKCDEDFYQVCDRVAGLASPPVCGLNGQDENGFVTLNTDDLSKTLESDDFKGGLDFYENGDVSGKFRNIKINENSNRCNNLNAPEGQKFVEIRGEVVKYKERSSTLGSISTYESEGDITGQCILAKVSGSGDNQKITSINLQQAGNLCYTPEPPVFDNTKCSLSLYGIENQPGSDRGGVPGKDPSTSILSSIQCGAVVDTYKHLQVALRVQEGIQKCLEQAKIGEINGGYCERLVGQAVCDLVTNAVLPELAQSSSASMNKGDTRKSETLSSTLQIMRQSEKAYNQRYEGTALSQLGLSTDQILNTACLGAISGDWSVLEGNILSAIEDTEVEPVFGPPLAESRLQGYNPLTGEIAIRYQFTYAAISGGQTITTEYQFICNPAAPNGEYCPENQIVYSGEQGTEFKKRTLTVRRDGAVQDNIVVTENEGRFWYNQIQLVHKFRIKDDDREITQVFNIAHKSEIFDQCYWDGGLFGLGTTGDSTINGQVVAPIGGIKCETIFGEDSLLPSFEIDERNTKLLPEGQTAFYTGNSIYLDLSLSSRGNSENEELALAHYISCKANGDGTYKLGSNSQTPPIVTPLSISGDVSSLQLPIELVSEVEDVGTDNGNYVVTVDSLSNSQTHIALIGTSGTNSGEAFINNIQIGGRVQSSWQQDVETLTVQNLNVNSQNSLNQGTIIKLPVDGNNGKKLYVEFNGKPENIQVQVGNIVDNNGAREFVGVGYPLETAGELIEGACTLNARVLPLSQANQLTLDNFETYSPISQSDEEGNLIYDSRSLENNIFKKTIQVKKKSTLLEHFVGFTSPIKNSVIRLSENQKSIDL